MRSFMFPVLIVALAAGLSACQSKHQQGVKSSYLSQWVEVSADTATTTTAAQAVLEAEGLKDVKATSTNVDGTAEGKKADGTKINVTIEKTNDQSSQVSVNVGSMGDPELGADIATKIKARAEGR